MRGHRFVISIAIILFPFVPSRASIIDRVKAHVFEVRTSVSADSPKSSYGSGFVVDRKGLVVTNYHVVDSVTQERDTYKVFVVQGKESLEAEVVAIDAVHDLALLRVPRPFAGELRLAGAVPVLGERIQSIGIPMDLEMSVIEGTYNGILHYGPYDSIHMSAPLNSGMSGGPTINAKGEVIGVNVSILGRSQNISFAVPAMHVHALIKRAPPGLPIDSTLTSSKPAYRAQIEEQLLAAQSALVSDLEASGSQALKLPGFEVAKPSEILSCWSRQETEKKFRFKITQYYCDLYGASYVREGVLSGTYQLSYEVITNQKLNRWQFFSLINQRYNADQDFQSIFFEGQPEDFYTKYDCVDERTLNAAKVPLKVNYCVQGFVRYSRLLDAEVKAASLLRGSRDGLVFRARFYGFTLENIKRVVRWHLDRLRPR